MDLKQEGVETKAKQISWDNNGWQQKREEKAKRKQERTILQFYFSLIQNKCSGFPHFSAGIRSAVVGCESYEPYFFELKYKAKEEEGISWEKEIVDAVCMERECGSYENFPRKHGDKLQGLGSSKVWRVYDGALEKGSKHKAREIE